MLPLMVENVEVPHAAQQAQGTDVFRVETTGPDGTAKTVEVIKTHDGYLTRADRPAEGTGTPESTGADPVALVRAALIWGSRCPVGRVRQPLQPSLEGLPLTVDAGRWRACRVGRGGTLFWG